MKRKARSAEDSVSPELRDYVLRRERYRCVIDVLVTTGRLDRATVGRCAGELQAAHVRDSRGGRLSRRPPSIPRRLVACCRGHHTDDPVVDRAEVRAEVDRYLEIREGVDVDASRPHERIRRVRASGAADRLSGR